MPYLAGNRANRRSGSGSHIILEFSVHPGNFVHLGIELFNDTAHILNISVVLIFYRKTD